jgi:hypothetical protein
MFSLQALLFELRTFDVQKRVEGMLRGSDHTPVGRAIALAVCHALAQADIQTNVFCKSPDDFIEALQRLAVVTRDTRSPISESLNAWYARIKLLSKEAFRAALQLGYEVVLNNGSAVVVAMDKKVVD